MLLDAASLYQAKYLNKSPVQLHYLNYYSSVVRMRVKHLMRGLVNYSRQNKKRNPVSLAVAGL